MGYATPANPRGILLESKAKAACQEHFNGRLS